MNVEEIKKKEYVAFEKSINIKLFNQIIAFIIGTKTAEFSWDIYREIENKCIWAYRTNSSDIQEEYKFQYFGELLERFEERVGNDIKDVRAIALALGYATKLIEDNMIVDTQLINFISKITKLSENDIYLKGALYLYDSEKYYIYSEELMNKTYTNTEEIVFALSIFYERIDDFFKKNRMQIVNLLGNSRNISAIGNIGIYAWLIKNLYPLIYNDRKKDISLLKALIKIPTGLQIEVAIDSKKESTICKELINNGYHREEIIYLNYLILYYDTVPKSVKVGYSMVEEKIATNLCILMLNSYKPFDKNVYDLINEIICRFSKFEIKCYGHYKILNVIKDKINVVNPITFAEMFYILEENLYSFNILDKKWDIVVNIADSKKYQKIFDNFLLSSNYDKEKIKECINKYDTLTNKKYIESFFNYNHERTYIFNFLVEKSVILLKDIWEYDLTSKSIETHLKPYIREIHNKKSFEFLKYLLRLHKYSMSEINNFGFRFDDLVQYYSSSSNFEVYAIDVEREFLNSKEQKILFNCLEKFIFYNNTKIYFSFLKKTLHSDWICKLYSKDELRKLYISLCEIQPTEFKKEPLQRKYLTAEELDIIQEQKRLEKEEKNRIKFLEAEKFINEKFNQLEEKNNFHNLYAFCNKYYYDNIEIEICIKIIKKYMLDNMLIFSKESKEMLYFIKILELFMDKQQLTSTEFAKVTYKYIKEEVKNDECINATYEYSN